jgi:hypothetical protein
MNVHGIEWDLAEPHATGSPRYLSGEYRGCTIETLFTLSRCVWEWSFYDPASRDPETAVARGEAAQWCKAVDEAKDYIDGLGIPATEVSDWYTATVSNRYEADEDTLERDDGADPFVAVARVFQGDTQDPGAQWAMRITNERTGESRLIDPDTF